MPLDINAPLDINRSPLDIIMEQINVENSTELLASDFNFSLPTVASLMFSDVNTSVVLSPKVTSGFYGSQTVYYKRMDISVITDNDNVEIMPGASTTLSQIIPDINLLYGINLTPDDYYDVPLPVANPATPDAVLSVILQIKPTSYLFTGTTNLILGVKVKPVDNTGITRDHFMIVDTAVTTIYQNTVIALDTNHEPSQTFFLMRNALDVTKFRADHMLVLHNGDIVLKGEFEFDVALGTDPLATFDVTCIVLSTLGNIKVASNSNLFGDHTLLTYYQNKNINKVYALDRTGSIGTNTNNTYRYNLDGTLDAGYDPSGFLYTPSVLRVTDNGKLYIASQQFTAPLPSDPMITGKQIKIDRINADGSLDLGFSPVIIRSTGTADVTPVADMLPIFSQGLWVALKAIHGVATSGNAPIVNEVPFVLPTDPLDCSFNPVFRINENGSIFTNFKHLLLNNDPVTVYQDVVGFAIDDKVLSFKTDTVTLLTNRLNPLTGYVNRAAVSFNVDGEIINIAPERLSSDLRWIDAKTIFSQSNGNFLIYGTAINRLPAGGWSTGTSVLAMYDKNSQLLRVVYKPNVSSLTTLQIRKLAVYESVL